jgi:hypothetical protein
MKVQEQREHGNSNILQVAGPPRLWALHLQKLLVAFISMNIFTKSIKYVIYAGYFD